MFITLNASASLGIKSVVLNDSTIIDGTEVSAITLNNKDFSVNSIETLSGFLIDSSEIKLINLIKPKIGGDSGDSKFHNGPGLNIMSAKRGGDDSGG
jgi:hypothetical protein